MSCEISFCKDIEKEKLTKELNEVIKEIESIKNPALHDFKKIQKKTSKPIHIIRAPISQNREVCIAPAIQSFQFTQVTQLNCTQQAKCTTIAKEEMKGQKLPSFHELLSSLHTQGTV